MIPIAETNTVLTVKEYLGVIVTVKERFGATTEIKDYLSIISLGVKGPLYG